MNLLTLSCNTQPPLLLSASSIEQLMDSLVGWKIKDIKLTKSFSFDNFQDAIAFVNALAWIAHRERHHPDLSLHYNRVVISLSTHKAGGLTLNDFICAAKIESLLAHS